MLTSNDIDTVVLVHVINFIETNYTTAFCFESKLFIRWTQAFLPTSSCQYWKKAAGSTGKHWSFSCS